LEQVLQIHADIRPDIFIPHTTKYTKKLKKILKDEDRPIYAAVNAKDELIGYAFCQLQPSAVSNNMVPHKILYIDDLCVDASTRGMHAGEALFQSCKTRSQKMGCYEVTLAVWEGNDSARGFYEHVGLKPKETIMEYILEKKIKREFLQLFLSIPVITEIHDR
jgi:ribosomal protein S18 acetylase RimI-like enzyme